MPIWDFYSTYKELKLCINRQNQRSLCIFTLPIRNWNFASIDKIKEAFADFYSTYKELKHKLITFSWKNSPNFYSTYKELKPTMCLLSPPPKPDFYSTYKELKQWMYGYHKQDVIDFYSTYKELKPKMGWICKMVSRHIFTLPIRNWNCECSRHNKIFYRIFTLPIRNWNW